MEYLIEVAGHRYNIFLMTAGLLSLIAAALHIAIIFGGADWYRLFGAGERMAQLAEKGSRHPAIVTGVIASALGVWALYGFSAAGMLPRLPLLRESLALISVVFLLRGLLAIPAVLFLKYPYALELKEKMLFMVISSVLCLFIGACYAVGAWQGFAHG